MSAGNDRYTMANSPRTVTPVAMGNDMSVATGSSDEEAAGYR